MSHTRFTISAVGAVLFATVFLQPACSRQPDTEDVQVRTAVEGTLVTAASGRLDWTFEAGGLIQAETTATVTSRLLTDVRAVLVKAGDAVRRGQPLVLLDERGLAATRAQADAAAASARQGRVAAEAERAAAIAARDLAAVTFERIEGLHERRAATTQELDQARAALAGAHARLAAADARLTESAAGIDAAEAALQGAEIGLSYATLRSPFDGIVTAAPAEPGNQAGPGVPLVHVESRRRRVEVRLDAGRAAGLSVGDTAEVEIEGESAAATGTIVEIQHTLDAGLQTLIVRIILPDTVTTPSGRFARVRFTGPSREAIAVPTTAVVHRGQLLAVFVVGGDRTARLRLVSTGETSGGVTEIVAGLAPGESVLLAPPPHLLDGTPVTTPGGAGGARR